VDCAAGGEKVSQELHVRIKATPDGIDFLINGEMSSKHLAQAAAMFSARVIEFTGISFPTFVALLAAASQERPDRMTGTHIKVKRRHP
jgi:hypothetical protein